jgi:hypothetical protein
MTITTAPKSWKITKALRKVDPANINPEVKGRA